MSQTLCYDCNLPIKRGEQCVHSPPYGCGEPTHNSCCNKTKIEFEKMCMAIESGDVYYLKSREGEIGQDVVMKDSFEHCGLAIP